MIKHYRFYGLEYCFFENGCYVESKDIIFLGGADNNDSLNGVLIKLDPITLDILEIRRYLGIGFIYVTSDNNYIYLIGDKGYILKYDNEFNFIKGKRVTNSTRDMVLSMSSLNIGSNCLVMFDGHYCNNHKPGIFVIDKNFFNAIRIQFNNNDYPIEPLISNNDDIYMISVNKENNLLLLGKVKNDFRSYQVAYSLENFRIGFYGPKNDDIKFSGGILYDGSLVIAINVVSNNQGNVVSNKQELALIKVQVKEQFGNTYFNILRSVRLKAKGNGSVNLSFSGVNTPLDKGFLLSGWINYFEVGYFF